MFLPSLFTVACSSCEGYQRWELQASVNSEAEKHYVNDVFKITWHVKASGHLDYFGLAAWRRFMVMGSTVA